MKSSAITSRNSTSSLIPSLIPFWGGPDPKQLIEQSDLPDSARQVIHTVIKSSRLWRREKIEVANELLAHFEDGLRHGKKAEKLIRDFGDPMVAAQLIRSGKIRNRSMNSKLLYGGIWGFFLFLLSYFGMAAYFRSGEANPSHDYVADLNVPALAVAPEDAAWPIYRPMFIKFSFSEGGDGKFEEIFVKSGEESNLVTPQDGDAWKTAITKLDESAELLDAFRKARTKSHIGLPLYLDTRQYTDEDFAALYPKRKREENVAFEHPPELPKEIVDQSMIGLMLPHYQVFRTATRIMIVDTRWAIEQNDFERVTQNIESIFGFSRQLGNEPILVGDFVAFSLQSMGCDLLDECLPEHLDRFSDEQLARMQAALHDSDPRQMIDIEGDKLMALDVFQRCFTDDGSSDGRVTASGYALIQNYDRVISNRQQDLGMPQQLANTWKKFSAPFAAIQFPSRKQVEEGYLSRLTESEQELQRPYYSAANLKETEASKSESDQFLNYLLPAMPQVGTAMFKAKGQLDATAAAIAVYRHRNKTGKLPDNLDILAPTYLKELPVDQFDGQPLRYQKKDDGFILYSIGYDKIDNSGKRNLMSADASKPDLPRDQPEPTGQYRMFPFPGQEKGFDWVLWPRLSKNGF